MNEKIEGLLAQMTLEEKVSMLAGADMWHTVPVERLGVPAIKVTDGPNGARGAQSSGGPTSACFPVGVALGATWNPALVRRVGVALAEEVKSKGAHILLAPTVNIQRSPLAGRNFECYSEDPYLSGRMAVAYVDGLQSQGVGACIKHLVCNDSEFERFSISSEVDERTLREIYLSPFKVAVREAQPWAVMSAYNKLNGTHASENPYLLRDILKDEWGFDGIVMSDWYGTYSDAVAAGGLDLEMPGPARWMGTGVLEAVRAGDLDADVIDDKVRRLLRTIARAGAFERPELPPEQAIDRPAHRQLAREAAGEAIVLLKNENDLLPLDRAEINAIAVIGANARWAQIQGGGSAHVTPHYVVSPLDGIRARAGDAEVGYAVGCTVNKLLPLFDVSWLRSEDGAQNGLTARYFDNLDLSGAPVHTGVTPSSQLVWFGDTAPHIDPHRFSLRLTGTFTAPEKGTYTLGVLSVGKSRLFVDGVERLDMWSGGAENVLHQTGGERTVEIVLAAGQTCQLQVEYAAVAGARWRTLRLGCLPPLPHHPVGEAVALAARSDVALVFAGLTDEWESEGFDRPDMALPGEQAELIRQVAAANPNTVVVLNAGSPVDMDWLDQVPAVVQAWYTGQETGNAIADVLFGDANPSGRLPLTFPRRLQDNPAYVNYPGENGRVRYGEGLFVGYRYYDKKDIEPLFPFGYGLSYTTFAYKRLALDADAYAPGDEIRVSVEIENTGSRAGQEVVQLYIRDLASSLVRPEKELKAFAKVALAPGETRTITLTLGQDALSFYDPARKSWVAEAGEFEILVGSSARDLRLRGRFRLEEGASTGDGPGETARLHVGLPLQALLDDARAKAVLERHIPEILKAPELSMALGMSLEQVAPFVPQILTAGKLAEIDDDLTAVQ